MTAIRFVLLVSMAMITVKGHPAYVNNIPNGQRVPNPDGSGKIWLAVGHMDPLGGDALNPFGIDFQSQHYSWTRQLCYMDSDGDGITNGQELGDPQCTWIQGNPDPPGDVTHPGFPEKQ